MRQPSLHFAVTDGHFASLNQFMRREPPRFTPAALKSCAETRCFRLLTTETIHVARPFTHVLRRCASRAQLIATVRASFVGRRRSSAVCQSIILCHAISFSFATLSIVLWIASSPRR